MAARPWITPGELKSYTAKDTLSVRSDQSLAQDIAHAEEYIMAWTGNTFPDGEYPLLPVSVRIAALLLSEAFADEAASGRGRLKSERLDDYTWTADTTGVDPRALCIDKLLMPFCRDKASGSAFFRMRAV